MASGRRRLLLRLVANGAGQAAATLASALLIRESFDRLIAGPDIADLRLVARLTLSLAVAAIFFAFLRLLERRDSERMGQDYIYSVRRSLFDHLLALPTRVLHNRSHGALMLRFIGDLSALRQWVSLGLARLCVAGIAIGGTVLAIASINGRLAVVVVAILLAGVLAARWTGNGLRKRVIEARRARSRLAANVDEKIAHSSVVQAYGQQHRERNRLLRQSSELRDAMVDRATSAGLLRAINDATAGLAAVGVIIAGAFEVAAGRASTGSIAAIILVIGMLVPRLRDLGRVQEYWYGAQVSREKLEEFLALGPRLRERRRAPDHAIEGGEIQFRGVSLRGALRNFSATAEAGKIIAIVGPNGAGKSTLLSLAARLIEPDSGQVLLDGAPLTQRNLKSLRQAISIFNPDLPLLRGSLERNLRYRAPGADRAELDRVIELVGLESLIMSLPRGLRYRISDAGRNLSTGQRQRVAIARALLGKPAVLLLDEPDANLDPHSARLIDDVLAKRLQTVLMVTHRPDRLSMVDEIWQIEDGRLVAHGTPEQMLSPDGHSSKLIDAALPLAS